MICLFFDNAIERIHLEISSKFLCSRPDIPQQFSDIRQDIAMVVNDFPMRTLRCISDCKFSMFPAEVEFYSLLSEFLRNIRGSSVGQVL